MKKFTLFIVLLLVSAGLTAQSLSKSKDRKGVILNANAGVSIPTGKYGYSGTSDTLDTGSGFAKTGFFIQLAAYWMGSHGFGLGLTYIYQNNPLSKDVQKFVPDGQTVPLGTKPWSNNYIMAGPYLKKNIGERFFIEAAVHAGGVICSSSNFTITVPAYDSLSQPSTSTSPGLGFAFQAKVGAGIDLSDKIGLAANLGYLGGSPSRTKSYYYYTYRLDPILGLVPVYQGGEFTIKKKINTFNFNISLIIKL